MDLSYPLLNVLLVGVGGIGCEVLKMVSKLKFQALHIIDMDTIEVSNLNRQFLFKKHHRGQSKSLVAKQTMLKMAPNMNIIAHHAAINSPGFTFDFFTQFDAVIMALDNAETRSYVNKVCKAQGIFIVDAGSMGFAGQANTYYPTASECYDCNPKATSQKQYPACTIRSLPTNCVHCIIWAKYLFQQLFTETTKEDDSGILEVDNKDDAMAVYLKFFNVGDQVLDIQDSMIPVYRIDPYTKYSLNALQGLWFRSFEQLKGRDIVFDKDEPLHIQFIYAATLMRCMNFKLEQYDFHKIKTISGNIIHAIASTNSIVAALEVSKLLSFMLKKPTTYQELKGSTYYSTGKRERILTTTSSKRSTTCNSCVELQFKLVIDFQVTQLNELIGMIKQAIKQDIINLVYQSRLLWDDEDDDMVDNMKCKLLIKLFNTELDNRIVIKNMDEQLLGVLWLIHGIDNVGVLQSARKQNIILAFEQPLVDKLRVRQRPQQQHVIPQAQQQRQELTLDDDDEQLPRKQIVQLIID